MGPRSEVFLINTLLFSAVMALFQYHQCLVDDLQVEETLEAETGVVEVVVVVVARELEVVLVVGELMILCQRI